MVGVGIVAKAPLSRISSEGGGRGIVGREREWVAVVVGHRCHLSVVVVVVVGCPYAY